MTSGSQNLIFFFHNERKAINFLIDVKRRKEKVVFLVADAFRMKSKSVHIDRGYTKAAAAKLLKSIYINMASPVA